MSSTRAKAAFIALIPFFFSVAAQAVPERASVSTEDALLRLRQNTVGQLFEKSYPNTAYTFLQATGGQPLMTDGGVGTPVERARLFLSLYGAALGISDPLQQLTLQRISTDQIGRTHVHLDQVQEGLPVYGARIVVHMDATGIVGVNGVFVRDLPTPSLIVPRDVGTLRQAAVLEATRAHDGAALRVDHGNWVIYPEGLLQGQLGMSRLAYEAIVVPQDGQKPIRDRVLVDATNGRVLETINDIHTFLNREIYTPDQTTPPMYDESATTLTIPKGPADPALINDVGPHSATLSARRNRRAEDNLWIFDGGTYALYNNMFGRKGYDACDLAGPCQPDKAAADWSPLRTKPYDGQIQKSVYLINQNCPNAYWNGDATNYCPGFDADDVVSHEWSHAYTQYTHGLIYAYQSGALNEGWSDIFGETFDLVNAEEGPLGVNLKENEYYENGGSRWVVGEDLSEQVAALLLRDMWKPDDFPAKNPGKATSKNYSCGSGDGGGVHSNSSVPNHAYAMLVDGTKDQGPKGSTGAVRDTFNGQSFMPGIGIIKAAQIYFYAENNIQTPTTDFPQHANALRMSCQALKSAATDLKGPTGAASGQVITQADCDKLEQAILATELDLGSPCPYIPVLKQNPPAACEGATNFFQENWENGGAGWTKTSTGVFADWDDSTRPLRDWTLKNANLPLGHSGTVAFAKNIPIGEPGGGTCQPGGDYSGEFTYDSPAFTVPAGSSKIELRFDHYVNTEATADGGLLMIKVNGGSYTIVSQANYKFNPPNSTLLGTADTSNNPNGGEYAWNGADVNPPSGSPPSQWGTTVVNLAALAKPGDTVRLRFDFSQEGCNGRDGWYVDDIRAFSCPTLAAPTLSLGADYTNPDPDGSYSLSWVRPSGASGPDVLQASLTSCSALLFDDAESGLGKWNVTTMGSGATAWQVVNNQKPQHAGNTFWGTAQEGAANATSLLTTKVAVAIPAQGATALTFEDWDVNEGDDNVYVEVSLNSTDWSKVYSHNRSALAPDGSAAFASEPMFFHTIDLTSYAGQSLKLRFRFATGPDNRAGSTPLGWYLDNIAIRNDNWGDILNTTGTTHTLSNQLDGTKCYRVRTAYPVNGELLSSQYSNVVTARVLAGLTNLPPVANAGADQTVTENGRVQLDGSQSVEPNGDPLTYSWRELTGSVVLADAGTARPSFTAPSATSTPLVFELTVTDPQGVADSDTVVVTVTAGASAGNNRLVGALPLLSIGVLGLLGLRRRMKRR